MKLEVENNLAEIGGFFGKYQLRSIFEPKIIYISHEFSAIY